MALRAMIAQAALCLLLALTAAPAPAAATARKLAQADTIASVASGVPDLSTLVAAVSASPVILGAATDPSTAVTVFAPTNAVSGCGLGPPTPSPTSRPPRLLTNPGRRRRAELKIWRCRYAAPLRAANVTAGARLARGRAVNAPTCDRRPAPTSDQKPRHADFCCPRS
eukprot:363593-Chlamydomonas_euryale.AAC.9